MPHRRLTISALASGGPRRSGRGHDLPRACHEGRLEGGLSVSLRATPDELVGALTSALGGPARGLKVLDVREGPPMVLEVAWGELHEKWEVPDLEVLVHDLNDLFAEEPTLAAAVLGEWEDMLQLWCVPKAVLPRLLDEGLLASARNRAMLERLAGR